MILVHELAVARVKRVESLKNHFRSSSSILLVASPLVKKMRKISVSIFRYSLSSRDVEFGGRISVMSGVLIAKNGTLGLRRSECLG